MISKILSAAVIGLEGELVEVEADIGFDLPKILIVGLPDKAVEEAKERVKSAIKNSSADFPRRKITVNLAPADLKKVGPLYDLPIAVSILMVSGQIKSFPENQKNLFIGELSLNGDLRPVSGVLSIALLAKKVGVDFLYLPKANAKEASLVSSLKIIPISNLSELIFHLKGITPLLSLSQSPVEDVHDISRVDPSHDIDFSHIRGQRSAKRALEIAAAGSHNLLMHGPPGAGKTMLARSLTGILPEMTEQEKIEVTQIYSVATSLDPETPRIEIRPFRNPHHTASGVSLIGGGSYPRPGEISLAHRGVLFLDEFAEFPRSVLENLRQPLEDGRISVTRAAASIHFPAQFMMVASMNPCPCGFFGDEKKNCQCSAGQIVNYQKKISGPLLDRIDMYIEVARASYENLTSSIAEEKSEYVRRRVEDARKIQLNRFDKAGLKILTNAEMSSRQTDTLCKLDEKSQKFLKQAVNSFSLSARSYFRILKIARTIADLEQSEDIHYRHILEVFQYRMKSDHS